MKGMYQVMRDAAVDGIERQKRMLAGRLRNAASRAREVTSGDADRTSVGQFSEWLADRLDAGASAVEARSLEQAIEELKDVAHRHPAATLAVAAGVAFACARLAMPPPLSRAAGAGGDGGRGHA